MEIGKLLIIILAALARVVPHPPNFAPIAGIALFSGANYKKGSAFIVPLAAMLLADLFLGFHAVMPYVYFSFFIIVLLGKTLKNFKFQQLVGVSLLASILFFLITNFGVWATSGMYVKNVNGLVNAYLMGLPFLRNTLLGDLFYSFSLFYGYKYFILIYKKLRFGFGQADVTSAEGHLDRKGWE